jgi:hypothetical protein
MTTRFNPFRRAETAPDPIPETNGATSSAILANGGGPDFTRLFIAAYGQPDAPKISLPYGHMAVTLCAKFNDSAPQVDHFDYHAHLGCHDFALLIVPKQSKTEKLARQALSLCPELAVGAGLDWTWKSETWSMGHGNYLQSSVFELPPELRGCATFTFGRNTPLTQAFWEIEFTTNLREGKLVEMWPHRNFRNVSALPPHRSEGNLRGPITASVKLNHERQGVEIHFTRRPDDAALQPLRDDRRWRYTGFSRCWYSRATPETVAWANDFVTRFNSVAVDVSPRPLPNGDTTPAPPGSRAVRDVVSPALSERPERPPHRSTPQLAPLRGMTPLGINP